MDILGFALAFLFILFFLIAQKAGREQESTFYLFAALSGLCFGGLFWILIAVVGSS